MVLLGHFCQRVQHLWASLGNNFILECPCEDDICCYYEYYAEVDWATRQSLSITINSVREKEYEGGPAIVQWQRDLPVL